MGIDVRTIALACTITLSLGAPSWAGDDTVGFDLDDDVINAAKAEAKNSFPLFLGQATDADGVSVGNAAVKVAFEIKPPEPGLEVIWVAPFVAYDANTFAGLLANEPNDMPGLSAGDAVRFTADMVADWSWTGPDGKLYGNYTTRVMLPQLGASADALRERLADSPVPDAWK